MSENFQIASMRGAIACLLALLICFPISCQKSKGVQSEDKAVAKVGDMTITQRDLIRYYRTVMGPSGVAEGQKPPGSLALKKALLQKLIEKWVLLKEASKEGVTVGDGEVAQLYQSVAEDYGKNFDAYLKKLGVKPTEWKEALRQDLVIKKVMEQHLQKVEKPTEKEIKAYYRAHQDEFQLPMRYHFLQIVMPTLKMAEEVRKELKAGEDFASLAKRYSISPEGKQGGDMGYWREDRLPREFLIVKQMKIGEISDIIHTPFGYHILMLVGVRDAEQLPLKEAAPQISEKLMEQKREAERARWIRALKEKAHIVVYEKTLKKTVFN